MPRLAANLTLLFNEVPFPERFAAAAQAGFSGVEFLFPYDYPPALLAGLLREQGLIQVLFNLPPGDWAGGERGIACLPDRVAEFRRGVVEALRYAEVLGCRQLNCLAGLLPQAAARDAYHATLVSNLAWAARQLASAGITLMVEAINSKVDMPGFLLDSSARALQAIDEAGEPNVRLQYDLYHMQIMEGDLLRSLERELPRIGHIQFADNPGRHQPGTGELNFARIFERLDQLGYAGWVGAEYRPLGSTWGSLASLQPWLKPGDAGAITTS